MAKVMITIAGYRCERCRHEWIPRTKTDEEPTICPKCKSPYWNKPKTKRRKPPANHAVSSGKRLA